MNTLERTAIIMATNADRLIAWARRYEQATGRRPRLGCRWVPPHVIRERLERLRAEQHGNSNVIIMPRHKAQYRGVELPTSPDAA